MGRRRYVGIAGPFSRIVLGVIALGSLALSAMHSASTTKERNLAGPDCIHVTCTQPATTAKQLPVAPNAAPALPVSSGYDF